MKDNEQTMLFLIFHIVVNHLSRLHFYKNLKSATIIQYTIKGRFMSR